MAVLIRLLGPVDAVHGNQAVPLGGPRQRAVFAILTLAGSRTVSTDALVDGVWGDNPPGQPLASLQVYVHGLRGALAKVGLGRDVLASRPPGYLLDLGGHRVDVDDFELAWQRSRELSQVPDPVAAVAALEEGLGRWRGPGLADLRGLPFAQTPGVRLDEMRALAEEDLLDLLLASGRHPHVVGRAEALVAEHPTRERRWGQLMLALYRCNRQADALAAYARARDMLADELGIDPGKALQQIEIGILRHDPRLAAPLPGAAHTVGQTGVVAAGPTASGSTNVDGTPARRQPDPAVHPRRELRLPHPTTTTWGRAGLVADLVTRVCSPNTRLLTLVGPGGTGKTRLATLVAREAPGFEGGRYFLAAQEGHDAAGFLASLVLAMGGAEPHDPTTTSAAEAVADQLTPHVPSLVVLDNLEVVPDAAYAVETLLKSTDQLTVLATSRLPLHLNFEVEVVVPPLEVPDSRMPPASVASHPTVAFFVDRAQLVNQRFQVDDGNRDDVVALCRLLGGVPLALELAAARMRVLTPGAALRRLSSGLDLLSSDRSDATAAQSRTLTGTINWSLSHLSESARTLLDDLCVFEDGFGLEGVETVSGRLPALSADGGPGALSDPVDDLGSLLDCGLVHVKDTRVELRYRILAPVRMHVLANGGDLVRRRDEVRSLHLAWMLKRIGQWAAQLDGPEGDVALARFDDEHADIVSLVDWAVQRGHTDAAATLAGHAAAYWLAAGRVREGLERVSGFGHAQLTSSARRRLRIGEARLTYQAGDFARTEQICRSLLESEPQPFPEEPAARCYLAAAVIAAEGPGPEAVAEAHTALRLARDQEQWDVQAVALSVLAIASAMSGDLEAERGCYEERLVVARTRGDRARTADTLNTLAEIAIDEPRDLASARDHVTEALRLAGEHRPMERRDGLVTAARVSVLAGELDRAVVELVEALDLSSRTGQPHGAAQAARVAACVLVARGHRRDAIRLFAMADVLSPAEGDDGEPFESDLREALRTARAGLGLDEVERLARLATLTVDTTTVVAAARAAVAPPAAARG
ncbi:hypothetical protein BA895_17495 [Humibacillus sp. DSM 29435]|nr:hypothetical protein BA895_17495 [Humibacillus sp. DSM 29435]